MENQVHKSVPPGTSPAEKKTERDNYKTQLDTAQTTLKSFEGVNVQDLQGKVIKLTADLAAKDAEYQKQIADRDFNDLLKTTAEGYKPRDLMCGCHRGEMVFR